MDSSKFYAHVVIPFESHLLVTLDDGKLIVKFMRDIHTMAPAVAILGDTGSVDSTEDKTELVEGIIKAIYKEMHRHLEPLVAGITHIADEDLPKNEMPS